MRRRASPRPRALLAGVAVALLAGCGSPAPPPDDRAAAAADAGYVGVGACAPCHAEIAASYARTGMGRSFHPLTESSLVEDFTERNRLDLPGDLLAYEMTSRDGRWHVRQIVLDEEGREVASHEREILYVLGSGNHSRSYLTGERGWLYQMPVCWYPDKPGWDLCPGYEESNFFFMREADEDCLFCHNARVPLVEGTTHRYGEKMPHGVDCERCHGPGAAHVAFWKARPEVMPDRDTTIVNPRRLDPAARIQVCMQCHLGESVGTVRVRRGGRDPRDYRPGADLLDYFDPIAFAEPLENLFGLSAQADRLLRSRCFVESAGAMDCLACHDPHSSVHALDDAAAHFRSACLGCHGEEGCTLEKAARIRGGADDCAGCHMRRSEPADQRFTVFTDHWIRTRPAPPAPPVPKRTSLALAPLFPDRHASLDRAEALYDLGRAYARMKQAHPTGSAIPWSEAERALRASVEADPSRADGWFQLGSVVLENGNRTEALGCFREALRLDPRHFAAHRKLGAVLLSLGRHAEAVESLREAVALRGEDVESLVNLGRALVESGDESGAESLFRRAAEAGPSHSIPLANLGLLAARRGRHEEAIGSLTAAVAREPSRAEIWEALAASLRETGRTAEADSAGRRAQRIRAGAKRPPVLPMSAAG